MAFSPPWDLGEYDTTLLDASSLSACSRILIGM
jgi:hypothetical protein